MSWMVPWSKVIEVIFGGFSIQTNAGGPATKLAAAPAVAGSRADSPGVKGGSGQSSESATALSNSASVVVIWPSSDTATTAAESSRFLTVGEAAESFCSDEPIADRVQASRPVASGDLRTRLHASLVEAQKMFIADALEHAEVVENGNELVITASKVYQMSLKDPALENAACFLHRENLLTKFALGGDVRQLRLQVIPDLAQVLWVPGLPVVE